jgi:hypothetical protein
VNALSVLHNTADVFDWADTLPADLQARISEQASDRYSRRPMNSTYFVFLNVTRPPFSSQLAREAVVAGLDQHTLSQIGRGVLRPGCFLLPPGMYGHPHGSCPGAAQPGSGNVAAAVALVKRSGMEGARVTVWSSTGAPARGWMAYYAALLNRIGFRASLRAIRDSSYYATIGRRRLHPQTGFAELSPSLPNPAELYATLTAEAIRPANNRNWGEIDDPYINAQVNTLAGIPAAQLSAVADFWHALEQRVASKAYVAVIGYRAFPEFVSRRIDYPAIVFDPVAGFDWSSFSPK